MNFIDTSELYPLPSRPGTHGLSEKYLGSWLARNPEWRPRLVIGTKVVGYMKSTFLEQGRQRENGYCAANARLVRKTSTRLSKSQVIQACQASLARLGTDYVDVFYLHWPDRYVPMFGRTLFDPKHARADTVAFSETVSAIGDLLRQGLIRAWGVSNETCFGICQLVQECDNQGVARPVAVQNGFSMLNRQFETDSIAEACARHHLNLSLVAFSPLCGGALTGKYLVAAPAPAGSRFAEFEKFEKQFNAPLVRQAVLEYGRVAEQVGEPLTTLALHFVFSRPCMMDNGVAILGATTLEQLVANLDALRKNTCDVITRGVADQVDQIYLRFKDPANSL